MTVPTFVRRAVALAVTATAATVLLGQAPASAGLKLENGVFPTLQWCEDNRVFSDDGMKFLGPCEYKDKPGTESDGWYFWSYY
ncbi:hypothetical protein AB0M43_07375 [Longispora sp. NPDC051575]|uniref:hypothetical protein n=1 Tax=Longispora sp. NPDC051575 TaxID=3154943 RepID=UPI00343FDB2A